MVQIRIFLLSNLFFFSFSIAFSQIAPNKYVVYLTDKNNNGFSVNSPEQFLTQRAIDRRERQNIEISENDLPLNQQYVDSLRKFNMKILNQSKWLNCVTIFTDDLSVLDSISTISFVKTVRKFELNENQKIEKFPKSESLKNQKLIKLETELKYGESENQITMLNGHKLHNLGFQGQEMLIAITDVGFYKANINTAFDSLRTNNQILATKNFVNQTNNVYSFHEHGSQVLSILASNKPDTIIGSAPKANYLLLISEDYNSEYRIEEYNWVSAAEFADSLGADIINVSLGYNIFSNTNQNYSYSDMDGKTSIISNACDIAASKGMLVVVSAGNEGNKSWKYITAPADADSVLTVGAVDANEIKAALSSIGPSSDGRIKPNVSAQGGSTAYYSSSEYVSHGSGTSFAAPIISGLAACLWQKYPQITNMQLKHFIEKSANQYDNPDNYLGYGLPDFEVANILLEDSFENKFINDEIVKVYENPFTNHIRLDFYSEENQSIDLAIFDILGHLKFKNSYTLGQNSYNKLEISNMDNLNLGIYVLRITNKKNQEFFQKLIKVKQ